MKEWSRWRQENGAALVGATELTFQVAEPV